MRVHPSRAKEMCAAAGLYTTPPGSPAAPVVVPGQVTISSSSSDDSLVVLAVEAVSANEEEDAMEVVAEAVNGEVLEEAEGVSFNGPVFICADVCKCVLIRFLFIICYVYSYGTST